MSDASCLGRTHTEPVNFAGWLPHLTATQRDVYSRRRRRWIWSRERGRQGDFWFRERVWGCNKESEKKGRCMWPRFSRKRASWSMVIFRVSFTKETQQLKKNNGMNNWNFWNGGLPRCRSHLLVDKSRWLRTWARIDKQVIMLCSTRNRAWLVSAMSEANYCVSSLLLLSNKKRGEKGTEQREARVGLDHAFCITQEKLLSCQKTGCHALRPPILLLNLLASTCWDQFDHSMPFDKLMRGKETPDLCRTIVFRGVGFFLSICGELHEQFSIDSAKLSSTLRTII